MSLKSAICRVLIVLMAWTPYKIAQAGMIGTDQVVSQQQSSDRDAVVSFLSRSDVSSQLQSLGVDPSTAKARVAAMTDQEVARLAQQIQSAPAGASSAGTLLVIIIIVAVIWWALK